MNLKENLRKVLFNLKKMSPAKKRFFILFAAFFILNLVIILLMSSARHRSVVNLEYYGSTETSRLYALDNPARKGFVKPYETANFKLNDVQKEKLNALLNADISDLQDLMKIGYKETHKKQYKILADPKNHDFIEKNIGELRKLVESEKS